MSLLCLAHHAVRLWRSPRRWPLAERPTPCRFVGNLTFSFPVSLGRWWPSLIRRNRLNYLRIHKFHTTICSQPIISPKHVNGSFRKSKASTSISKSLCFLISIEFDPFDKITWITLTLLVKRRNFLRFEISFVLPASKTLLSIDVLAYRSGL